MKYKTDHKFFKNMWSLLCSEKFRHSLQNAMLDELRFLTEKRQKQMLLFWCSLYQMWTTASDPIQKWCLNREKNKGECGQMAEEKQQILNIFKHLNRIFDKFLEDMYRWIINSDALKYFVQIIDCMFKSKILLKHI
ncbi:Hypothetical_protein [Hexamita inflata]|uniref:Hypothetical_protein n=1 Tax=Hexamita inflata TaxID=28002 RepID=A0AA86RSS8_9EUKA|nr:Hypothetical protein HINF_LOCUS59560 [Hexamita inflata]